MRRPVNKIERLLVDTIRVSDRMRALTGERVAALAASMGDIGLKTPIFVRAIDDVPHLIAGAHRLAAAQKLGWEEIDAIVLDGTDIEAKLWEIDENLARAELTTDEKAIHMVRRKELWDQKVAGSGTSRPTTSKGGRPKEFAADTAAATGISKRQVNRLVARGKELLDPTPKPKPAPLPERSAKEDWLTKMFALWARSEPDWREDFLAQIDTPVFDSTRAA